MSAGLRNARLSKAKQTQTVTVCGGDLLPTGRTAFKSDLGGSRGLGGHTKKGGKSLGGMEGRERKSKQSPKETPPLQKQSILLSLSVEDEEGAKRREILSKFHNIHGALARRPNCSSGKNGTELAVRAGRP